MEHINDIELIEYVGGRLAARRHKQLQQHISICPDCAERWQEAVCTWDTLAEWDVDTAAHSVAARVEALAATDRPRRRRSWSAYLPRRNLFGLVFRVAASIIIGIGFGYILAKWTGPEHAPANAASGNAPKYVNALGLEWSNGFVWSVLDEPDLEKDKEKTNNETR
jgi:anti-sigma factor RsiW